MPEAHDLATPARLRSPREHQEDAEAYLDEIERVLSEAADPGDNPGDVLAHDEMVLRAVDSMARIAQAHATLATIR